jgi:hypothetical protein
MATAAQQIEIPGIERELSRDTLASALAKAQAEFTPVPKTKTARVRMKEEKGGGEYTYQYADFADILKMALPILGKHGLAFSQPLRRKDNRLYLISRVLFGTEVIESDGLILPEGLKPQEFGSILTYWRRYDGCSLLGIAPDEDTDANVGNSEPKKSGKRLKEPQEVAAPDGLPAVKCEDCGRGVIGYTGPDGPLTMQQALASSRARWDLDLCGGCQAKRTRTEPAKAIPEAQIVDMDGELHALGIITQVFPGKNSFSFRLGTNLMFSTFRKSLIPALTEAVKKPIEIVFKTTPDGKYRNLERVCTIDGKAFAHPAEIQESETR